MDEKKGLIITCPACGYTFRPIDLKSEKKVKKCPMCGQELSPSQFRPNKPNEFKKRTF
ncbi:MAG: hypothetical protein GF353_08840 [Candidatus Lokiarchaeota archaeon]|nr:hypothetical protein [Candidatus Lokiarchaeota archaeon]